MSSTIDHMLLPSEIERLFNGGMAVQLLNVLNLQVVSACGDTVVVASKFPGTNRGRPSLFRRFYNLERDSDSGYLSREISWFKSRYPIDGRISCFSRHFQFNGSWYMVFDLPAPRNTLSSIFANRDLWPLPMRHIRDISAQIALAVQAIHKENRIVGIVHPDRVEFMCADVIAEVYWDSDRLAMGSRYVLKSTELVLSFDGSFNISCPSTPREDIYRAPEVVLGWMCNGLSDTFSLGCIFAQLVMGEPVFFQCSRGSFYRQLMMLQYQKVLLPGSLACVRSNNVCPPSYDNTISLTHEDIIRHGGDDFVQFLKGRCNLEHRLGTDDCRDVVSVTTCYDFERRIAVEDFLKLKFFTTGNLIYYKHPQSFHV